MSETALVRFPEFKPMIASLTEKTKAQYEAFIRQRRYWLEKGGRDDRGRIPGRDTWSDPALNVEAWSMITTPISAGRPAARDAHPPAQAHVPLSRDRPSSAVHV
jgi:hypothetical protein